MHAQTKGGAKLKNIPGLRVLQQAIKGPGDTQITWKPWMELERAGTVDRLF